MKREGNPGLQKTVNPRHHLPSPVNLLPPPAACSVPWLGVELLTDVVNDLGHKLVEVVELIHKEGVLLVRVGGNVLQLILGGPGDTDGVRDHT